MMLAAGERTTERVGGVYVTFEGTADESFEITDKQLLAAIQARQLVEPGTRVRVAHYDDRRRWFEILRVIGIRSTRAA